MAKKHAPREQLRAAGKIAKEMLIKRGLRAKDSVIDKIITDSKAPILPGIPSYLPHEWTLKATQQILRDIVILWKEECRNNDEKIENITLFWHFAREQLYQQEKIFAKQTDAMPKLIESMKEIPVLRDIFSPLRKKENIQAIHRFVIDSFACAIVIKQHHTTSEYLNWFLDWTQDLAALWVRPSHRKRIKRT